MAYQPNSTRPLLTPGHEGRHPSVIRAQAIGPHPVDARVHEHAATQELGLARAGGKPKLNRIVTHGGMFHVTDGKLNQSVTATQVARAPDASGESPLEPAYRHSTVHAKQAQVPVHPAMGNSKTQASRGNHQPGLGEQVLSEGIGPDSSHPINIARFAQKTTER